MPEILSTGKIYSGSVKDVYGEPGKSPYYFHFSDRYSIFDWGEMPDSLPGKGESLAIMGDLFFQYLGASQNWLQWQIPDSYPKFWRDSFTTSSSWKDLKRNGLAHHSRGLVNENAEPLALGKKSKFLAVDAIGRPAAVMQQSAGKISWDYSEYQKKPQDCLVPLEVVFRFGAPEGSSFLQRLETIQDYGRSFGFSDEPKAGQNFPYPIVEFFTKLEPSDRFLTREEAMQVAALSQAELDHLVSLTLLIALRLKEVFGRVGLELWDGKFEFAFQPGEAADRGFRLVDSIGPDELRLIGPAGVHFSKEFLRRVYRGGAWFEAIEKAKKLAKERGQKDWKKICVEELGQSPEPLPKEAFECARLLYPALAEALMQSLYSRAVFESVPSIPQLCARLKELR